MQRPLLAVIAAVSILSASSALAQTPPSTTPSAPAATSSPAPAGTVAAGKRETCRTASQQLKGQDRKDQMQLCMAQARVDCLKQAIDQKVTGAQRKDFVKSCVAG